MFQNLTIKSRLIFVLALLSLFMVIIGAGGLISLSSTNASLKTVYDDRLVPMGQLDRVIRLVNRNQLTLTKAIIGDPAQINQKMDAIEKDREETDKVWAAYTSTYLTPEEKVLAQQFATGRQVFIDEALKPAVAAMRAQNVKLAIEITQGKMDHLYEKVRGPMNELIKLQLDVAQKEFEEAQRSYSKFRTLSIGLIIFGLILGAIIGLWLIRSISGPLDYAVGIARDIAGGDLTRKVEVNSTNETGQLLQALKDMNDSLVNIVGEVRISTDTISTASSEIAAGNLDLSSRTEEQAASLEETASSMEELTSTVKQNADNARQANQLAMSASEVALKGGTVVGQVVETMGSINDSSKKIVDIIGVIDGIAFQTNILALNAAVEAARAGEQGRGFAVVASEVRSLAQRSAGAAKEIKALIVDSVEKVDAGSKLVDQAGTTMQEVVDSIRRVTDIMGEITAASQEQTSGIEQINMAVTQMDQVTQQNAALVEEAAAAAASMQSQAGNLAKAVGVFRLTQGMGGANVSTRIPAKASHAVSAPKAKPAATVVPLKAQRTGTDRALPMRSTTDNADWEEF